EDRQTDHRRHGHRRFRLSLRGKDLSETEVMPSVVGHGSAIESGFISLRGTVTCDMACSRTLLRGGTTCEHSASTSVTIKDPSTGEWLRTVKSNSLSRK